MKPSAVDIAGSKSRQFSVSRIDRVFDFYKPGPPLSKFVDSFWLCAGDKPPHKPERILPTGTLELAINLDANELRFCDADHREAPTRFSGAVVSGSTGRGFAPDPDDEVFIIGVHFKPGGAFPFLGLPASELADRHVDLDSLWGSPAVQLRERLCEATNSAARFLILENALRSHLRAGIEQHYAVAAALEMFATKHGGPIVREAARGIGLSERRFIQAFKNEVGITPKLFSRIQRFQHTRHRIHHNSTEDWATLALDLGYCDQSHLIREFVEFSGQNPSEYLSTYTSSLRTHESH